MFILYHLYKVIFDLFNTVFSRKLDNFSTKWVVFSTKERKRERIVQTNRRLKVMFKIGS